MVVLPHIAKMNAISSSVNKGAFKVAPKAAIRRPRRSVDRSVEATRVTSETPERALSLQRETSAPIDNSQDVSQPTRRSGNVIPVVSSASIDSDRPSDATNVRKRAFSPTMDLSAHETETHEQHNASVARSSPSIRSLHVDHNTDAGASLHPTSKARRMNSGMKLDSEPTTLPLQDVGKNHQKTQTDYVKAEVSSRTQNRLRAAGRRKAREPTPELAELEVIDVTETRMLELCKDLRKGRKSSKYEQFKKIAAERRRQQRLAQLAGNQAQDVEIIKTQDEQNDPEPEEAIPAEDNEEEEVLDDDDDEHTKYLPEGTAGAPQVRIVDGQIVLDVGSLQVDRSMRDAAGNDMPIEYVEENPLERSTNSGTYAKRSINARWDALNTELFYSGLSQWGTDFDMISRMFPNRSRKQIKNKFTIEERRNPVLVTRALTKKQPVDMAEYSRMASIDYKSVDQLQTELAELTATFELEREEAIKEALERKQEAREELANANLTEEPRRKSRKKQMENGVEVVGDIDEVEAEERERAAHQSNVEEE